MNNSNLYFYNHLMEDIRTALEEERFETFKKDLLYSMSEFDNEDNAGKYDIAKGWKKG